MNVAIIGCGYVADIHLHAWSKLDFVNAVAACDVSEERVRRFCEKWHIPHHYTSLKSLLGGENVDLIDICTPPPFHSSIATQAIASGCHVLIEKPMTVTIREAEEIRRVEKESGVSVGVIHNALFDPIFLKVHPILEKGGIGEVVSVQVKVGVDVNSDLYLPAMMHDKDHWVNKLPAGRFGEMLAHPIYLLQSFLRHLEVESVSTSKISNHPCLVYDELLVILKSIDRKLGVIYISFNSLKDSWEITIYGTKATLRIDLSTGVVVKTANVSGSLVARAFDNLKQSFQIVTSTIMNSITMASGKWISGHEKLIHLFADSIISNKPLPVTTKDAYEVVRILEHICKIVDSSAEDNSS